MLIFMAKIIMRKKLTPLISAAIQKDFEKTHENYCVSFQNWCHFTQTLRFFGVNISSLMYVPPSKMLQLRLHTYCQ